MELDEPSSIEILLASLRRQAGRFPSEARDIEVAIAALELRRAYALMARLQERDAWVLTPDEEQALDDFWWEHAQ